MYPKMLYPRIPYSKLMYPKISYPKLWFAKILHPKIIYLKIPLFVKIRFEFIFFLLTVGLLNLALRAGVIWHATGLLVKISLILSFRCLFIGHSTGIGEILKRKICFTMTPFLPRSKLLYKIWPLNEFFARWAS